jgi:uncharacterized protein
MTAGCLHAKSRRCLRAIAWYALAMDARRQLIEALSHMLAQRAEVHDAYLFGSIARGDDRAGSDVDVAVWVDDAVLRAPGYGYDAELNADLQALLARSDIDVVVLNGAPPLLYYRVLRDGVRLVTRDPHQTSERETLALSRYFDYIPQLAKIEAAHKRARKSGS